MRYPARRPRAVPTVLTATALLLGSVMASAQAMSVAHRSLTSPLSSSSTSSPNLLTGDTAQLAGGTGSWTPTNANLSRVQSPANPASGTLAVTPTIAGWSMATSGSGPATWTPVAAGTVVTASVQTQASSTGRPVVLFLYFYSSSGTELARVKGQYNFDAAGSWTGTTPAVALAPAGTAFVAVGYLVWGADIGETHYLSAPLLTRRQNSTSAVVGPLTTRGNQIYSANGPVVLRGLHRFGLESGNGTLTKYEIDRAKKWGANFIRLSVGSPWWLSSDCHYDPNYAKRVDDALSWITGDGMVALLDLHYNSLSPCGAVGPQVMADSSALTFWKQAAARYKRNPLVAFDLYNEPHDISDAVWRNGGTVTSGGTTFQAAGMQQLYDAVRSTGSKNLVVVSGNSWANRFAGPISGTNIVYGVHAYTCPTSPTGSDCVTNPKDPSSILGSWVAPSTTYPVMVTEFGWPAKDDGTYVHNVISFAEAHGWGWSVFAWDGTNSGTFDLVTDAGPSATYEPNETGMPALKGFEKN